MLTPTQTLDLPQGLYWGTVAKQFADVPFLLSSTFGLDSVGSRSFSNWDSSGELWAMQAEMAFTLIFFEIVGTSPRSNKKQQYGK